MTVAELIEELRKFPGHHPVILETDEQDYEGGSCEVWSSVIELSARSNVGDLGPIVLIRGGDPA